MEKIIVSIIVVGLLLTTSIVSVNAIDVEVEHEYVGTLFQDDDVELLWNKSIENLSTGKDFIFSAFINDDDVPDILAESYVIDGATGDVLFQTEAGKIVGLGDVNNDNKDEVISCIDNSDAHQGNCTIYCLNASNGEIIWQTEINSSWFFSISVGNITGDENNEIVVGMGDFHYRGNNYIYCFDGSNGNIIWKKITDDYVKCTAIADVNFDGRNEVIASVRTAPFPIVFCLEGNHGYVVWEFVQSGWGNFKCLSIGNLNADPYKEILLPMGIFDGDISGICCISGKNGSIIWTWEGGPDHIYINPGSLQSLQIVDIIPSIPGNEIIAGFFCGAYCIHGADEAPPGGREIWHAGKGNNVNPGIVMSTSIGDLDGDGLLDVASLSWGGGGAYALNGQYGSRLWKYDGIGNDGSNTILCVDLTNDNVSEVVAINYILETRGIYALKSNFSPGNNVPNMPNIEGPTSGEIGEPYSYTATANDPENDELYYYFDWGDGTGDISRLASSGESITINHSWEERGIYTVKVKAIDEHGGESVWSDPLIVAIDNDPSNPPTIDGPASGEAGTEYEYTFSADDPDGDDIYLYIDWDDDTFEEWIGPYSSGEEVIVAHTWSEQGTYIVKAKAKDVFDAESDWGYLEVTMPFNQVTSRSTPSSQTFQSIIKTTLPTSR